MSKSFETIIKKMVYNCYILDTHRNYFLVTGKNIFYNAWLLFFEIIPVVVNRKNPHIIHYRLCVSVQSSSVIQIITSHVPWCLSSDNINRIKGFRTVADTGSSWTNSWQVCQNNPCFIHNSSYVYAWTVLEPPLPAFFCCNLQIFFFFVSRW